MFFRDPNSPNLATKSLRSHSNLDAMNHKIAPRKLIQNSPEIYESTTELADDIESVLFLSF